MTPIIWRALVCATAVVASAPTAWGQVRLEYIAHASFVVQSPEGTRVLIDRFSIASCKAKLLITVASIPI